jgi:hypothetical protein
MLVFDFDISFRIFEHIFDYFNGCLFTTLIIKFFVGPEGILPSWHTFTLTRISISLKKKKNGINDNLWSMYSS